MWICQNCKSNIDDDESQFCDNCGKPKEHSSSGDWVCPSCNANLTAEDTFCFECGKPRTKEDSGEETQETPMEQRPPKSNRRILLNAQTLPANTREVEEKTKAAPPSMSVTPAQPSSSQPPTQVPYSEPRQRFPEADIFASHFPDWDLLPPTIVIKRIRRNI
jgi:uncharacterized Zn finger protein (UPF0148 family)